MRAENKGYRLSVIIPTLDEAEAIGGLLRNLDLQRGADMEVLVCDGGSKDGTVEAVTAMASLLNFPVRVISVDRGRGVQMNAGARAAKGEVLLFLHADSVFGDDSALRKGVETLELCIEETGRHRVAGRFRLRFLRRDTAPSFFYYYGECKARLDREGCTHGDQGFMLSRAFFEEAGPFDESCAVLEDTRVAESVRCKGSWVLFDSEISTSARRFETEGQKERHALNAILMTLHFTGRDDLILELPGIYSGQKGPGRLMVLPFLERMASMLREMPWRDRLGFWKRVGRYVCRNAWQPLFALDARRNFRRGIPPGGGEYRWLGFFDGNIDGIANSTPMVFFASCLAWCAFRLLLLWFRLRNV